MPPSTLFRFLPLNRLRVATAALVLLAFAVSIAVLSGNVLRQIEKESESRSDNGQWALSQMEVELVQFVLALDSAHDGAGTLTELRLRFDVFYSRLSTLQEGRVFAGLRHKPSYIESIGRLSGFMESQVPVIDGPDDALRASLPKLYIDAKRMIAEARVVSLAGVEVITQASDKRRRDIAWTLTLTGLLTAALVAVLVALLALLLQMFRHNRRRGEENLETLSRLDAIVATAMEAIITLDSRGRIVDFNAAACATLGYARDEAVGADMADLIAALPNGQSLFTKGAAPDMRGNGRVRVLARHKDGQQFPAEMSISRTRESDGTLYVAFLRDLSAQLAAEQTLTVARDKALAGEKAKANLLVVMSHEIRTPLNGMIGTIELLETTDLQPHQREYLRIMEASGKLLMHHVNDVLDIARLDSGKAPYTVGPVDLAALVQEVMENQRPANLANGNDMRFAGPVDGRSLVECDGAQLRQILLNLVGNAVKFTRNGHIGIEMQHLSDSGPTEIVISDTGIGIPKTDLGRIFDDFVTLDASYARRASGTGLGLGIVRRIVARMGGVLTVDSQEGKGSTVRMRLPLQILGTPLPQLAAGPAAAVVKTGPKSILVVEDNEFNRLIVREMLLKEGHQVYEARDGEEGIALAASRQFDLILMDISMPRVDGMQAALAILGGHGASAQAPVVAMTAHALPDEAARFRAGGMAQVLVKPITRDALRAVLAGLPAKAAHTPMVRLVDLAVLRSLAQDLGPDRADSLTRKFLAEARIIVETIAANLTPAQPDTAVMRDLHRLEGSAAMFGAQALQGHLSDIETAWKLGTAPEATARLSELLVLWQKTEQAFQDAGVFAQPSSLR